MMKSDKARELKPRRLAPEDRLDRQLTGRGGIGLVCFHLARQRIEFVVMPDRCSSGDIWAQINGRKFGIEVKASHRASAWQIKKSQLAAVDYYVLVAMDSAQCFILAPLELTAILDTSVRMYGDVYLVKANQIPAQHRDAWRRIDGEPPNNASPSIIVRPRVVTKSPKIVRKKLADGTVRTYKYERASVSKREPWKPVENDGILI